MIGNGFLNVILVLTGIETLILVLDIAVVINNLVSTSVC